ncbi:STAS domain-containing protein [Nonomuraea harbinensis]|uniref:STAS domain-containing protein n=1 Tax=Nonomuraea harbinensis TaxID=1286938 RepID=A0ABW1C8W5_9ACTN
MAGELDFLAAPGLLAAVSAALPVKSPRLVLDVGGVTLCDSLGLEALLDVQRTASSRGGSMETGARERQASSCSRSGGAGSRIHDRAMQPAHGCG